MLLTLLDNRGLSSCYTNPESPADSSAKVMSSRSGPANEIVLGDKDASVRAPRRKNKGLSVRFCIEKDGRKCLGGSGKGEGMGGIQSK